MNLIKFFQKTVLSILTVLLFTGCPPYSETKINDPAPAGSNIESLLSKTSSGQDSVNYLNQLRQQGYNVEYVFASEAQITSLNGHNGGGFKRQGSAISIYINNGLGENEQAHVVAHELVHIKDDLEIDQVLKSYSYIDYAAQDFVSNYKYRDINDFDQNAVSYVTGTLFCAEARAYTKNQILYNQGLSTSYMAHGSNLGQHIDQTYITQFGVSYGNSAIQMQNWCLGFSSMTAIQNALIW